MQGTICIHKGHTVLEDTTKTRHNDNMEHKDEDNFGYMLFTRPSPDHHQIITRPSPDHHLIITRPSPDHHQVITRSSPDHHQTITRPSPHHHHIMSTLLHTYTFLLNHMCLKSQLLKTLICDVANHFFIMFIT